MMMYGINDTNISLVLSPWQVVLDEGQLKTLTTIEGSLKDTTWDVFLFCYCVFIDWCSVAVLVLY